MSGPECVEKFKPVKGSADTKFRGKFPSRVFRNCDHWPIQKRYEVQAQGVSFRSVIYAKEGSSKKICFL